MKQSELREASQRQGETNPVDCESSQTLRADEAGCLGAGWPPHQQRQLLVAACGAGETPIAAWQNWRQHLETTNIHNLDVASMSLLLQACVRLGELGVRDILLDQALAVYRSVESASQTRLRSAAVSAKSLDAGGIEALAIDELPLLFGLYPDIGTRQVLRLKLLVRKAEFAKALRILLDAGWRSKFAPVPPKVLAGELPRGCRWQLMRDQQELGLHCHALYQDASDAVDSVFWTHSRMLTLNDVSVRCPHPTELLLTACVHGLAWKGAPSGLWAADAHRIIHGGEPVNWERLMATVAQRQFTLPVYDGLRFLTQTLATAVPTSVMEALAAMPVCELECLEYTAMTCKSRDADAGERCAMYQMRSRRREGTECPSNDCRAPGNQVVAPSTRLARIPSLRVPSFVARETAAGDQEASALSDEPLVTCLCVTENRHAFIPWLLWSYDRQSWAKRELVIIDSSDPPIEIPDRPDVRVIRAPLGTPLGKKRNMALDAVRGEVFAWFDDDDWQHPMRLRWQVERLQAQPAGSRPTHVGPNRGWFIDVYGLGCTEYVARQVTLFNGCVFVSANVQKYRFCDEMTSSEDTVWMRGLSLKRGVLVFERERQPMFCWLSHETNTCNPRTRRCLNRSIDELSGLLGPYWGDTKEQLLALQNRVLSLSAERARSVIVDESCHSGKPGDCGAARPSSALPNLWVVTTCMGRLNHLRCSVPLVLRHHQVHQCIVDYSCPDHCGDWIRTQFPSAVDSGRCVVESVSGHTLFNKCSALNAGARRAQREGAQYLCFLDADTLVDRECFNWLLPQLEKRRFFIAARQSSDFDLPSLTGLLVVSADEFARTDGFDETFRGWGFEDIEMRLRLHIVHGLAYADVPLSLVQPIAHDDQMRSASYAEKDIQTSNRQNMWRVVTKLTEWRRKYRFRRDSIGRLLYHPPPPNEKPITHSERAARRYQGSPPAAARARDFWFY